jgi:nickel-dependent lactate racemase
MNKFNLPFGISSIDLILPPSLKADLIQPIDIEPAPDPLKEVKDSLDLSIGLSLDQLIFKTSTIAIAVNDKTRPVPHLYLLPPLLKKLERYGVSNNNITIIIATGTHLPMTQEEFQLILPADICGNYVVLSHNCDDRQKLINLGLTSRGTPSYVNRKFYESDVKIVTGNIEPHHFMGYSGGVKSAAIGLAGRKTINANHSMLTDPNSKIGLYETNPMRQDIEEIGKLMGIDFALNAILNSNKSISKVFSGDPIQVMKAGISLVKEKCQIPVRGPYDIVIASPGGHPKDINLYQSQKAITHASEITKEGGVIIIVAACSEGSGSKAFQQFMVGVNSYSQVIDKFNSEGFKVGPHKAFQIAREASRTHIILVSQLPPDLVRNWLMTPAINLDDAINISLSILPNAHRVAIMPRATNTIPVLLTDE